MAWTFETLSEEAYPYVYWKRLSELKYGFLGEDARAAVETALRFTLSTEGVDTAIVGTAKPNRWQQNADLVAKGHYHRNYMMRLEHDGKKSPEQIGLAGLNKMHIF